MQPFKKIVMAVATAVAAGSLVMTATPSAGAATGLSYLREGSYGAGVACAQWAANTYLDPQYPKVPIAVDGSFGTKTKAQIIWFQEQEDLQQDGVVGPNTGNAIMSVINRYIHYDGDLKIWKGYWLSDCFSHVPTS
jgi:hypothetical protein